MRRALGVGTVALAVAGLAVVAVPAQATVAGPVMSPALALPRFGGGEPSIAADPTGNGTVIVTAPQGVPAVAGCQLLGAATCNGVAAWRSTNFGVSFDAGQGVGSLTGGGDSDVAIAPDHTVYVADLEAVAAALCVSADGGRTYGTGAVVNTACNGLALNQQGPENDREWLTVGRHGEVYLTYHDFTAGFPIILRSDDKARTFLPCGTILNPSSAAGQNYNPAQGTLVAKPAVGKDGSLYVEVTEPDQTSTTAVGAALDNLFMTVAKGGCSGGTVFSNYTIYRNTGASLGEIFNADAIDGAGTLYVVAAGRTTAGQTNHNIWLFVSHDGGQTWTAPIRVNTPNLTANVLPAITGGLGSNQVALGWFGSSTSGDPNNTKDRWNYYVATSLDGGRTFQQSAVALSGKWAGSYVHYGDICTQGLFCGLVPGQPGNRDLADFSSLTVNPRTGCLLLAFPADPYNNNPATKPPSTDNFSSTAYVSRQVGGSCLAPTPTTPGPQRPPAAKPPAGSASGPTTAAVGSGLADTGSDPAIPVIGLALLVAVGVGSRALRP
ncbi:MAG TPA: sialidase family protein [Mycobacteriales bacterium]|nr:sialidase family protein [Mycobacteriales bacterium]